MLTVFMVLTSGGFSFTRTQMAIPTSLVVICPAGFTSLTMSTSKKDDAKEASLDAFGIWGNVCISWLVPLQQRVVGYAPFSNM